MYDLMIKNGKVVDGREIRETNIYVKDGRFAKVTTADLPSQHIEDADGAYIIPGCIDPHCHFRDPGATYKEDFKHGTTGAAVGGITTVFDMPNTNPAVLDEKSFLYKKDYFADKAFVDYGLWGLSLGDINLAKLKEIKKAGGVGIKFFWGYAINKATNALVYNYVPGEEGVIPPLDDGEVYQIFEEIAKNDQLLAIHAENNELISMLTKRIKDSGRNDYAALLEARPDLAEGLTIQTAIAFSQATGAHLHVLHVTSKMGVEMIRKAKAEKINVTAETCTHYLFLSDKDYGKIGAGIKVYPPIKHEYDRKALWEGLRDGTIDYVSSDHAPHAVREKQGGLFDIPSGMCGVETTLPLMLNEVSKGHMTLPFLVRVLAENAARLYNIDYCKGFIKEGCDADFVILDMNKKQKILNEKLHSKEPFTPFNGFETTGWPQKTFLRGRLIAQNGEPVSPQALGKFLSVKM
ncbi:dihydroorotase [Pectinatus sottacetonis]|uniref:dihydroorotase n=1 Tax=Pectinatus sottacetonis TaxID=1002795 RepID=UPI0018C5EBEB|nr:dihydroorotase family protein [Pectinatus sottacetonis]